MAKKDYDYTCADYVNIKFRCNCGFVIETGSIPVKERYDVNKDINSFSHNKPIDCPNCHESHIIYFYDNSIRCESYCDIPSLQNESSIISLHEIPFEYAEGYDNSLIDYIEDINIIKDFIKRKLKSKRQNKDLELLNRMVFTYLFSIMDAYLGNTFRYYVWNYDIFKERYLQYKSKGKKVCIKDMKKQLERKSFQNLKETTIPYYQNTFGISIPENEIIQNAVNIRNSIIHNFGKEKDGYEHQITSDLINELMYEIKSLITLVNEKLLNILPYSIQ